MSEQTLTFKQFITPLLLGILPWCFAIGIGLLNDAYFNFGEGIALLLIPLIFSPLLLARKFGTSETAVFLAATFWLMAGGMFAWLG